MSRLAKMRKRLIRMLPESLRWFLNVSPYKCAECKDAGWASYADRIGVVTYHVYDHCRSCRPRQPE